MQNDRVGYNMNGFERVAAAAKADRNYNFQDIGAGEHAPPTGARIVLGAEDYLLAVEDPLELPV